jgi:hypothetical protein
MSRRRKRSRVRFKPTVLAIGPLVEEFAAWLVETEGLSPAQAKEYAAVVVDYQQTMGISDADLKALPRDDIDQCIEYLDRCLEELDREEAEDLMNFPPGEPEH